jgi:hypothetical protein
MSVQTFPAVHSWLVKEKLRFSIKASSTAQGYLLRFEGPTFSQQAEGKSIEEAIDALAELVFVQKL